MLLPSPTFSLLLLASFCSFFPTDAYKILVFSPATSKSHLISNGRIADELALAGHDVTLLEIDFLKIADTTKSAKLAKKLIVRDLKGSAQFKKVLMSFSEHVLDEERLITSLYGHSAYQGIYNELCEEFLTRDELFLSLKAQKFDAFFAEQINLCGFGYAKALEIPRLFLVSSCPFFTNVYDYTGLPAPWSAVPFASDMSPEPTYLERATSVLSGITHTVLFRHLNGKLTEIFREKFGPSFPSVTEIARNVDIIFLATDEIIDFSSPTLPNLVHIGGLGVDDDTTDMPANYAAEMEKGKNGVIYFSLGTIANTSTIDKKVMESFLKIAEKFADYHFLVRADKYDVNTKKMAEKISNVMVSDWLPQPAILHHPRLRTFITHAGYNGIVEAARAGVPLILIPFMFDQNLNSRAIEKKGWGIRRHKTQLLSEPQAIEEAIREMLNNPQYTEEAHRVRDLIKSKPMGARERFIKTTEWAIQNGGVHELQSDTRASSLIVYYNLDIFLPAFLIISFVLVKFLRLLGYWYYLSCFGHIDSKKKNKVE